MRTDPQGSYATHLTVSRYDSGPSAGHTLDDFHDAPERTGVVWIIAAAIVVGAMLLAYAWPR